MTVLPPLRDIIVKYGLSPRKNLGQNFIFDTNLIDKIVRAAQIRSPAAFEKGTVIEVGPGPGGLTRSILEHGARHLVAVEKDERCLNILAEIEKAYPGRLEALNTDALTLDLAALGNAPRCILSNLPYNVGTPLLIGWLKQARAFSGMTLMFQKEVAERITATPGRSAYGRLAILSQWLCETEILFTVNRAAFTPPPKVTSAVVHLKPRAEPLAPARFDLLERVTAAAFGQRRKMLRSSLKSVGNPEELCLAADVPATARAEEIPVTAFCAMARALEK
ncbi:MAG: 16S rRNA (adenine(1518)-N(6)/adenine(1519)-N(6))-dimethyltransferase RsmA [Alphaproteobacteria bacterium]|jgi:16S rRNA (adenine1518-N6/adenine1519-N6)-dimethyltransferase